MIRIWIVFTVASFQYSAKSILIGDVTKKLEAINCQDDLCNTGDDSVCVRELTLTHDYYFTVTDCRAKKVLACRKDRIYEVTKEGCRDVIEADTQMSTDTPISPYNGNYVNNPMLKISEAFVSYIPDLGLRLSVPPNLTSQQLSIDYYDQSIPNKRKIEPKNIMKVYDHKYKFMDSSNSPTPPKSYVELVNRLASNMLRDQPQENQSMSTSIDEHKQISKLTDGILFNNSNIENESKINERFSTTFPTVNGENKIKHISVEPKMSTVSFQFNNITYKPILYDMVTSRTHKRNHSKRHKHRKEKAEVCDNSTCVDPMEPVCLKIKSKNGKHKVFSYIKVETCEIKRLFMCSGTSSKEVSMSRCFSKSELSAQESEATTFTTTPSLPTITTAAVATENLTDYQQYVTLDTDYTDYPKTTESAHPKELFLDRSQILYITPEAKTTVVTFDNINCDDSQCLEEIDNAFCVRVSNHNSRFGDMSPYVLVDTCDVKRAMYCNKNIQYEVVSKTNCFLRSSDQLLGVQTIEVQDNMHQMQEMDPRGQVI